MDHRARLEFLLARDDVAAAKRQASRVDGQSQRIAEARIRLKASPAAVQSVIAGLPDSMRDDPAILFEEARALRRRGKDEDAWAAMLRAPLDKDTFVLPDRWWNERNIMTRDALKARNMSVAYDLVSQHAMDSGSGFADAEFLAGWISLRFQNKPDVAAGHFRALSQAVSLPISRARAYYWLGRAEEAPAGEEAGARPCPLLGVDERADREAQEDPVVQRVEAVVGGRQLVARHDRGQERRPKHRVVVAEAPLVEEREQRVERRGRALRRFLEGRGRGAERVRAAWTRPAAHARSAAARRHSAWRP